jgi:tRNA threonylcarbamoyl adenosine modification protein (Sua5/YciO/YrdC/YwlC family)
MIKQALVALTRDEVIGVPTDTVYGLAVNSYSPDALDRLFEVKGRPADRPVSVLVGSIEQAQKIVEFNGRARELAEAHWPGPLTLVLKRSDGVPDHVGDAATATIGVRMPKHQVALQMLTEAGPLLVSSANRSGEAPAVDSAAAEEMFGDLIEFYLPGAAGAGESSTVVDLTGDEPIVLRAGPIAIK